MVIITETILGTGYSVLCWKVLLLEIWGCSEKIKRTRTRRKITILTRKIIMDTIIIRKITIDRKE